MRAHTTYHHRSPTLTVARDRPSHPTFSQCLAMAMAALGLDTDLNKIRKLGPRPLLLAAALWAWLLLGVGSVVRILVAVIP